jgi:hypothetical protein
MSTEFRTESKDSDVAADAKAAYDARRVNASKTPSRKDRARGNSTGDFAKFNGREAVVAAREKDNDRSPEGLAAARAVNSPSSIAETKQSNGFMDDPDVEGARKKMDQGKKDAWLKRRGAK